MADALRAETRRKVETLSPAERIDLAFQLGGEDLDLLVHARGIPRTEAARLVARSRQVGRAFSRSAAGGDR
ncbi:MAG TPA: hypothetical protein VND92_04305 [Vicinamibacterales bacterium]|nr:hypothetical protein [Vicinamibacterales bacterium]